jgi:hypothetical protein
MELLVVLILLCPVLRDFHDGAKDLRRAIADGEFQVVDHLLSP